MYFDSFGRYISNIEVTHRFGLNTLKTDKSIYDYIFFREYLSLSRLMTHKEKGLVLKWFDTIYQVTLFVLISDSKVKF